jgi:hypothetical protein
MPTWISLIPWKLVGVVVLCLAISGLWYRGDHYMKAAAKLETQLDSAIEVANANAANAEAAAKREQAVQVVISKGETKKQAIRRSADVVRGVIADAPVEDDAPLAPVLRAELDRLPAPDPDSPEGRAADSHRAAFRPAADGGADAPARRRDAEGRGAGDRGLSGSAELLQRR